MTIIKDTDLFVVNRGTEVYNYSGEQLASDIAEALASRDLKVWIQSDAPFISVPPDYASHKDLWYDTSIGAFFIAQYDASGTYVTWVIVNPADHRNFLEMEPGDIVFPESDGSVLEFVHPTTGITYYSKPQKNQWVDKDLPGLDTFVLKEGDTMTGALQLPNLIVTGDDSVEAHIELNEGLLTADDSVVGDEQRLYWNGDTVAKHEDVVTLTNSVVNIDQHLENITPYAYRGLLRNSTVQEAEAYVLYTAAGDITSDVTQAEKVFLSETGVGIDGIDADEIINGMYVEVQAVSGTDLLTGKVIGKSNVTGGAEFTLDVTRAQGNATVGDISHVRIFSVADSSAKAGVYYQSTAPEADVELLKPGQLWVDSSTNIQYIWTGEEWSEVGAACGSGSGTDIPVGIIWPYAGDVTADLPLPRGWLLCNGSSFDPLKYPKLSAILNASKVPDLRGRFLGGAGHASLSNNSNTGASKPRVFIDDKTKKPGSLSINTKINVNGEVSNHAHTINDHYDHVHKVTGIKVKTKSQKMAGNDNSKTNGAELMDPSKSDRNSMGNVELKAPDVFTGNSQHSANNTNTNPRSHTVNQSGSHNHTIVSSGWDSYTIPRTFTVNWIIKHD